MKAVTISARTLLMIAASVGALLIVGVVGLYVASTGTQSMLRVLKPGGRIAVLTTAARGPAAVRRASVAASQLAPLRLFDVHDITMAFRAAGLVDIQRKVTAASQTVSGRRPEA